MKSKFYFKCSHMYSCVSVYINVQKNYKMFIQIIACTIWVYSMATRRIFYFINAQLPLLYRNVMFAWSVAPCLNNCNALYSIYHKLMLHLLHLQHSLDLHFCSHKLSHILTIIIMHSSHRCIVLERM